MHQLTDREKCKGYSHYSENVTQLALVVQQTLVVSCIQTQVVKNSIH